MARIALVTDSTCDLPKGLAEELNISVVPLSVIFGTDNYLDGIDLTPDSFFEMLRTSPHHPSTSQPAPGDFAKIYERLRGKYDHVVSLHLSSKLSGTFHAAELARDLFPDMDIRLVDTRSASIGLGWIAILAARAIAAGKSVDEVVAVVESAASKQHIFLTVESLEWLQKNGRIGKASALLGGLLNVRPLLHLEDGLIAPYDKVRGKMEKLMARMVEAAKDFVPTDQSVFLGIVHAERPEYADVISQMVSEEYSIKEKVITSVGPVIGVNTGPGTVGFVLIPVEN